MTDITYIARKSGGSTMIVFPGKHIGKKYTCTEWKNGSIVYTEVKE